LFIIPWRLESLVLGTQNIEKTVKFALAYITDIADLHRLTRLPWAWVPQGISVGRKSDSQLFAKDVVVGHSVMQESRKTRNARGKEETLPQRWNNVTVGLKASKYKYTDAQRAT